MTELTIDMYMKQLIIRSKIQFGDTQNVQCKRFILEETPSDITKCGSMKPRVVTGFAKRITLKERRMQGRQRRGFTDASKFPYEKSKLSQSWLSHAADLDDSIFGDEELDKLEDSIANIEL